MSYLFISYAREDKEFVSRLHDALEGRQRSTWVDWEGIPPTAEWLSEIYGAIDAAQAFVFVLTPDSVASNVCRQELEHAIEANKRLIPLVVREADGQKIPDSIRQLNWIFARDEGEFENAIDTLIEAVDTDLDRVKAHTRLLVRAREWDKQHHHSLLLRSRDLAEAERQFIGGADLEPKPTPLQFRYLTSSRKRATRVQRIILGAVTGGMVVAIALAIVAWVQRQHSERRAAAAFVQSIADVKPMTALAHAVIETGRVFSDDVPEVRSSLLSTLQMPKEATIYEVADKWPIASVTLGANGSVVAALDPRFVDEPDHSLTVWDSLGNPKALASFGSATTAVASCSAEPLLLIGSADGSLRLWDLEAGVELDLAPGDSVRPAAVTWGERERPVSPPASLDTVVTDPGFDIYGAGLPPPPPTRPDLDVYGLGGAEIAGTDTAVVDGIELASGASEPQASPASASAVSAAPASCPYSRDAIRLAALSANCATIAVVRGCATEVWSRSPGLRLVGKLREVSAPLAVAIDTAGRTIARGYADGSIRRATSPPGRLAFVDAEVARVASANAVDALTVGLDGKAIVSGDGSTVRFWHEEGSEFRQVGDGFHGHDDRVSAVAIDPVAGAFVVSGARDNSVRLWDLDGNPLGEPRQGHDSWVRSIAMSPDARWIISGSNDGSVRGWSASSNLGAMPCRDSGEPPIEVLAVSDDEEITLVHVWDWVTGMSEVYSQDRGCRRDLEVRGERRQVADLTPDGRFIVYGAQGGSTIRLRERAAGMEEMVISHPEAGLRVIAISPDGSSVAIGGNDRIVRVWSRADSTFRDFPIAHDLPILSLAFSSDGRTIASGSEDNTVQLWDVEKGRQLGRRFQGHKGWISAVTFSHDGRFIATGSWDRTVRLWDRDGNSMGRPLRGHVDWITHVRFQRAGDSVISYGNDQRVGAWQGGAPTDWLREACRRLQRYPGVRDEEENEIYERAREACSVTSLAAARGPRLE